MELHLDNLLLGTSKTVNKTYGNINLNYGGAGSGPSRSRKRNTWDNGWE